MARYVRQFTRMPIRLSVLTAGVVIACGLSATDCASACPWCETQTAAQVRAAIFDGNFLSHAVQTVLPLVVLALIVAAVYFWPSSRGASHHVHR
jgi:hypothetical protein